MPRTVTVTLSDGTQHVYQNVPDTTTPDDVTARATQDFGKVVTNIDGGKEPHPIGWVDSAGRFINSVARGALKTGAAAANMAADTVTQGYPTLGDPLELQPKIDKLLPPNPPAATTGDKYVDAVGEGMGSMVGNPAGLARAPIRTILTGGMAGAGGQAGHDLTNGNPLGEIAGNFAGGLTTSGLMALHPTGKQLARLATEGLSEDDLKAALVNMLGAKQSGIDLNASQALGQGSNLDAAISRLANSRYGTKTIEQLRAQPQQVVTGVDSERFGLPGDVRSPQNNANNAQDAADAAIRAGLQRARDAWQAAAPQGSAIPAQAVQTLDQELAALASKYPNTSGADLINDARKALVAGTTPAVPAQPAPVSPAGNRVGTPTPAQPASTMYLTDALQLKSALNDALDTFGSRKLNTPGLDATNLRRAQEVRQAFNDVVNKYAPQLTQANQAFQSVMESDVEPLKKSVVGRIAGRAGAQTDLEAPAAKLKQVLNTPQNPAATSSDILDLEKALRPVPNGPETFQDTVVSHLADKVTQATKMEGGRMSPDVAGSLEQSLGSSNLKNTRDMLVGLARSQGKPDETYVNGFMNLLRYVGMAAQRPASVAGITEADMTHAATNPLARGVAGFTFFRPQAQPLRSLNEFLNQNAHSYLDYLLTSPEGMRDLIKISKTNPISNAANGVVNSSLAAFERQYKPQPSQPAASNPAPVTAE